PQLCAANKMIVVDYSSRDHSRKLVAALASCDSRNRIIDNPDQQAAAAMNRGIRAARGGIIVRADAHCVYPSDYIGRLVGALETFQADNVGGAWKATPSTSTNKAKAIARALEH